jgi:glycosyltransferase involved in cell wall biosynthesis
MPSTSMRSELVSAVIPAHNAQATIAATISSIMAQTYRQMELIVVDDGSHDETATLVRKLAGRNPRIRLIRQSNKGPAAARNTGIEHARGDFVAPVDADDVWHPTKIEKQIEIMRRGGPRVGLVYCWARAIDENGYILFDLPAFSYRGDVFAPLILCNFVGSGSPLFRRKLALDAGGYDVSLAARGATVCEDLKFNLDLAERCDFDLTPEFLFGYTLRPGSRSSSTAEMLRSRAVVIGEAQINHPELPGRLFRWASAINARIYSQIYLETGQFSKASKLILEAAAKDPLGALGPHARRTVINGLLGRIAPRNEFRAFFRRARGIFANDPAEAQTFGRVAYFNADPTKSNGCPSPSWRSRRFLYVGDLRTTRAQPVG